MKIFTLNYEYPPAGGGGGRVAQQVARELVRRGHEVRVLTVRTGDLARHENDNGVAVRRCFAFRSRLDRCSVLEMVGFVACAFAPALAEIARWKPDVIHAHFAVPTGALAFGVHMFSRVPYVLTAHCGDVPGGQPEETDRYFRWIKPFTVPIWRSAAAVTAVSSDIRRLAEAAYSVPVETIPNGIERASVAAPAHVGRPRRLVFAGRLTPQKEPILLADALASVRDLAWEMDVFGDGVLFDAFRERVRAAGIADRVRLHGWVDQARVDRAFEECDAMLLPSRAEGLSLAALKALNAGLALIVTDAIGNRDVVQPGVNGWICPRSDANRFAAALREALTVDDARFLEMKRASLELSHQFDLEVVVSRYESVLKRACKRPDAL